MPRGNILHIFIFPCRPASGNAQFPAKRQPRSTSYLGSTSAISDYSWVIADTRSETTRRMDPRSPRLLQLRRSAHGLGAFPSLKNRIMNSHPTKGYYLDALQHRMIPNIRKKMVRNASPPSFIIKTLRQTELVGLFLGRALFFPTSDSYFPQAREGYQQYFPQSQEKYSQGLGNSRTAYLRQTLGSQRTNYPPCPSVPSPEG